MRAPQLVITAVLLSVIAYVLCLKFGFPGYCSPLAPFHSDFYDYLATARWSFTQLAGYPRPVAYFGMKLLANLDVQGLLFGGVALAITNAVLAGLLILRVAGLFQFRLATALGLLLYFVLLFSHPQFYFEHRHDLPAAFSLLFLLIAAHAGLSWLRHPAPVVGILASLSLAACVFSKETYFLSIPLLFLALSVSAGTRPQVTAGLIVIATLCLASFAWSRALGTPFINPAAAETEAYRLSLQPSSIVQGYWFFLSKAIPSAAAAACLIAAIARWHHQRKQAVATLLFVLAGLASLFPHSLLPMHRLQEYAFVAVPLLFAPIVLVASMPSPKLSAKAFSLLTAAFAIAAVFQARGIYFDKELQWYRSQEQIGKQIYKSIKRLQSRLDCTSTVLAGIETPFSPWQTPDVVSLYFGSKRFWTVVVADPNPSHYPNSEWTSFLPAESVQLDRYTCVAKYRPDGRLQELDRIADIPASERSRPILQVLPLLRRVEDALKEEHAGRLVLLQGAQEALRWKAFQTAERYLLLAQPMQEPGEYWWPHLMGQVRAGLHASQNGNAAQISAGALPDSRAKLVWIVPPGRIIEIHVGSPKGPVFHTGAGSGEAITGPWAPPGTSFFLIDGTQPGSRVLDEITVQSQAPAKAN